VGQLYHYLDDFHIDGSIDIGSKTKIEGEPHAPVGKVIQFFHRATNRGDQFRADYQKVYDGIQIAFEVFWGITARAPLRSNRRHGWTPAARTSGMMVRDGARKRAAVRQGASDLGDGSSIPAEGLVKLLTLVLLGSHTKPTVAWRPTEVTQTDSCHGILCGGDDQ
jgi:hypothetical protein